MKITENNYTVTTIYFDSQFWCALIEKNINNQNYAGRYVFGAEPNNPRLLNWMLKELSHIPLLPVEGRQKIRFKKLAKANSESSNKIPKSLTAFSKAQKEYAESRKKQEKKLKKLETKEKYLLKQLKKKK